MNTGSIIVPCKQCGTKNRVPQNRIKDRPICARCRTPLPAAAAFSTPVVITDQSFHNEVLSFPGPVLLDCWAAWCGPCKMIAPVIDQLAREYAGRVKVAKLNVDQNPITASRYHVLSIPTLLLFKNGAHVHTLTGALPKEAIEQQLTRIFHET